MISSETYYLGGADNNWISATASEYYDAERDSSQVYSGNPASTIQNIGLMYPSDYGYAAGSSCLSTSLFTYNSSCKNSDYLSGLTEWLQTHYIGNDIAVAYLSYNGSVVGADVSVIADQEVRPTLYLNTNVQITGGDGSQFNPFQLLL